jgi:hypothetical protein
MVFLLPVGMVLGALLFSGLLLSERCDEWIGGLHVNHLRSRLRDN